MDFTMREAAAFPGLVEYIQRTYFYGPSRYGLLFKLILTNKCKRIVEIGVYDGLTAEQMIKTAQIISERVHYTGFDLFDSEDKNLYERELSKASFSVDAISDRLQKTGAIIQLYKGDSRVTLPEQLRYLAPDFVFIDGGHSEETIISDWHNVEQIMSNNTIVVFDDYYVDRPESISDFGCNAIVDNLSRDVYTVEHMHPINSFVKRWGKMNIQMVKVTKK